MTNEELVSKIKAGEDAAQNMERLYLQNKAFIGSIAWKYRGMGELEDLEQEGYMALYPAIDGYDSSYGVKFLTYAEKWIHQRIRRYLEQGTSCLRLPVHCMEKIMAYKKCVGDFQTQHGRDPSDREAAAYMGFTLEQIENIKRNVCMLNLTSLDAPVTGSDGGEDTTVGDFIQDNGSTEDEVLDRVAKEELRSVLWECVDSLPGRLPGVMRGRYLHGKTLKELSAVYGVSLDRIRQNQNKGIREMRKPGIADRLRPFLEESAEIYGSAIEGGGVGRFNQTWTSSTERVALKLYSGHTVTKPSNGFVNGYGRK